MLNTGGAYAKSFIQENWDITKEDYLIWQTNGPRFHEG